LTSILHVNVVELTFPRSYFMRASLPFLASTMAIFWATSALAAETVTPVRMGAGAMTFDTVPGWGLRPDGHSALGPTHGGVVVDKAGNVFTSADKGVV